MYFYYILHTYYAYLHVHSSFQPQGHRVFLIVVPLNPSTTPLYIRQHSTNPISPNDERLYLVKRALSNKQAYLSSLSRRCL